MSGASRTVGGLAEELLAAATTLDRSAADVEAAQAARVRRLEQLRRELAPGGV